MEMMKMTEMTEMTQIWRAAVSRDMA